MRKRGRKSVSWGIAHARAVAISCLALILLIAGPFVVLGGNGAPTYSNDDGLRALLADDAGIVAQKTVDAIGLVAEHDGEMTGPLDESAEKPNEPYTEGEMTIIPTPSGEVAISREQMEDYDGADYQRGVVLVQPTEGYSGEDIVAALEQAGAHGARIEEDGAGYLQLTVPEGLDVEQTAALLRSQQVVQAAQPNFLYKVMDEVPISAAQEDGPVAVSRGTQQTEGQRVTTLEALPQGEEPAAQGPPTALLPQASGSNDPGGGNQWALSSMRVYDAWNLAKGNNKVAIAVIDQAFDTGHEDLAGNVVDTRDIGDGDTDVRAGSSETMAHGTHVAGIAAARTGNGKGIAGVSYNANLVLLKLLDADGCMTTDSICKAYAYIGDYNKKNSAKVRVVNMSIGLKTTAAALSTSDQAVYNAISTAYDNGIVTVCSAGNLGGSYGTSPFYNFPADCDKAVSVINLERAGSSGNSADVRRASSSNYNAAGERTKNIAAPGSDIYSTWPGNDYRNDTGTSMAAPQVAGVFALVFAKNPNLTAAQAVNVVYGTAKDLGAKGFDADTGYGEVDAYAAVSKATTGAGGNASANVQTAKQWTVAGASRMPVGSTSLWTLKNCTLKVMSGFDVVSVGGSTVTAKKAGTATIGVVNSLGKVASTRTVSVYSLAGAYHIQSALDVSKVVDVSGASTDNGGNVIVWRKNGGTNQKFRFERQKDGTYIIRSAKSGKVLDVSGKSRNDGGNVIQWVSNNGANQRWRITVDASNRISFANANSGKMLDISGAKAVDGRNVQQWRQNGSAAQKWTLASVKVDCGSIYEGTYRIAASKNTSFTVDVNGGNAPKGANVTLWRYNGGANQKFRFTYVGRGLYRIQCMKSGCVLDVEGAAWRNGANVLQWSWNGGSNQLWKPVCNSDGSYTLYRNGNMSWALDINGGRMANGTNIQQWKANRSPAQKFRLYQY